MSQFLRRLVKVERLKSQPSQRVGIMAQNMTLDHTLNAPSMLVTP
jgi:hypothetical protein